MNGWPVNFFLCVVLHLYQIPQYLPIALCNLAVACGFIDYKASYDSVSRNELCRAMREMNIPTKLIQLKVNTKKNRVKVGGYFGGTFSVNSGLRKTYSFAPLLFNIVNAIIKRLTRG